MTQAFDIAKQTVQVPVYDVPWRNLGRPVDKAMTAAEAIVAGGLDWTVEKRQLFYPNGPQGDLEPILDRYAIVRTDRDHDNVLGMCKGRYMPLQNIEAFDFFDPIVSEHVAMYHMAGALRGGERVWILAKFPDEIKIGEDDFIDKYLLLTNGHDGMSAVEARFVPVRRSTGTTLMTSLRGGSHKIRHSKHVHDKIRQAAELMGITNKYYEDLEAAFQSMAAKPILQAEADKLFEKVVGESAKKAERLQELFNNSVGSSKGTVWGAYNALTEFVDHHVGYETDDTKLDNVWFKQGRQLKAKAFDLARKLAE